MLNEQEAKLYGKFWTVEMPREVDKVHKQLSELRCEIGQLKMLVAHWKRLAEINKY